MPSDAQIVSEILPRLSRTDRDTLEKKLRALKKLDPVDKDEGDWLLHGFIAELRQRGLWIKSLSDLKLQGYYRNFVIKSAEIRDYFEDSIPNMTRSEKLLLGEMAAQVLAEDLQQWASVCLESMFSNVDKIPALLNKGFPGYLRSGLLGVIVGRSLNSNTSRLPAH